MTPVDALSNPAVMAACIRAQYLVFCLLRVRFPLRDGTRHRHSSHDDRPPAGQTPSMTFPTEDKIRQERCP